MKKEPRAGGIVAGGGAMIRSSEGFRKKMEEVRKRVEERYAGEYAETSWWGKFKVRGKMEREIRLEQKREGDRLSPPGALYLAGNGKS